MTLNFGKNRIFNEIEQSQNEFGKLKINQNEFGNLKIQNSL